MWESYALKATSLSHNLWLDFALKARKHRSKLCGSLESGLQPFKTFSGIVRVVVGKLVADLAESLPFISAS